METHHVFMNHEQPGPLHAADPWRNASVVWACPPPPPPQRSLSQRVTEALSAVGDTIRRASRSPSPASRHSGVSGYVAHEAMRQGTPHHSGYPWYDAQPPLMQHQHPPWMHPPMDSSYAWTTRPPQAERPYVPENSRPQPSHPSWDTPPTRPVYQAAPSYQDPTGPAVAPPTDAPGSTQPAPVSTTGGREAQTVVER